MWVDYVYKNEVCGLVIMCKCVQMHQNYTFMYLDAFDVTQYESGQTVLLFVVSRRSKYRMIESFSHDKLGLCLRNKKVTAKTKLGRLELISDINLGFITKTDFILK